jgi:serine/threonine protein phosphatase PrpC
MKLDAYALTVTGRRTSNQDAVCARPDLGLFVVADGMGGYEGGEIASRLAVDTIEDLVRRTAADADVTWPYGIDPRLGPIENEVAVATRFANEKIVERRTGRLHQMGTTVAVLRIDPTACVLAHVGDSRIYRLRDGALDQLTIDHSLYATLVAQGCPPGDDFPYHNVVTRALGTPSGEPDVDTVDVRDGDVFLLCTDGLSGVLDPPRIAELLALPPEAACHALVGIALDAGSRDNVSAIVVRCGVL